MAAKIFAKVGLVGRLLYYVVGVYWDFFRSGRRRIRIPKSITSAPATYGAAAPSPPRKNIVIIGASFSGYHAARQLAVTLPADGPYRVVVVEPNSHFHFTWVLPRFCVAEGHEHKALIPYGPYFKGAPQGMVRWITGRVSSVGRTSVTLEATGEDVPYEYLVVATGSGAGDGLPSRVGAAGKEEGLGLMRDMQRRIRDAKKIVVVGGGAAGVELATDAKDMYPEKEVVLVHSRSAVMHRFGPELQAGAMKGLQDLGVEVILNERATADAEGREVTLPKSGRKITCDVFISCVGQRPNSQLMAALAPDTISASGHIRVRPTLQIADDSLPNVYVCGDVADTGTRNPNARAAMKQATVVVGNIGVAISGGDSTGQQLQTYTPHWGDAVIKLTIGLYKSIAHFGDGETELLIRSKEAIDLMAKRSWMLMGAKAYEDTIDSLAPYRQAAEAASQS